MKLKTLREKILDLINEDVNSSSLQEESFSKILEVLFPIEITSIKITAYKQGYNDCKQFVLEAKNKLVREYNEKKNNN